MAKRETPSDSNADSEPQPISKDGSPQRVIDSASLFAGETQLAIVHERSVYILRKTRFGKLILTK